MLAHLLTTPVGQLEANPTLVGELPAFFDLSVMAGLDEHEDWLRWPGVDVPPMPLRMGADDPRRERLSIAVADASMYALRAATSNGKSAELDPDELVTQMLVGMFGYFTENGLSPDETVNPENSGEFLDMLGEQDPNAAWMSLAHVICYEAGIPSGDIRERLSILRDMVATMRHGTDDGVVGDAPLGFQ